jgi:hypothetical protein
MRRDSPVCVTDQLSGNVPKTGRPPPVVYPAAAAVMKNASSRVGDASSANVGDPKKAATSTMGTIMQHSVRSTHRAADCVSTWPAAPRT